MSELLQEFTDSRGVALRIDRPASVIRGIKILGLQSRNGRRYLPEALAAAAGLYEGAKVNVNHPKGSQLAPRDYQDRLGQVRHVDHRDDGLYGDLHFNPKHALAEQLLWDAEHAPENVGLSHNVEARLTRQGTETIVEEILRVQSVDLVADPATTRGLFEHAQQIATGSEPIPSDQTKQHRSEAPVPSCDDATSPTPDPLPPPTESNHQPPTTNYESLTLESLRARHPDLCAALLAEQAAEVGRLTAEVTRLQALVAHHGRPCARDQQSLDDAHYPCRDARAFVEAIRG